MAKIANCPCCAKQLCLPEGLQATDHVECPACTSAFALSEVVERTLPLARVLPAEAVTAEEPANESGSTASEAEAVPAIDTEPKSTSMASWEERLKKALGGDLGDLADSGQDSESQDPASLTHTSEIEGGEAEALKSPAPAAAFDFTRQFGIDLSTQSSATVPDTPPTPQTERSRSTFRPLQTPAPEADDFAQDVGAVAEAIESDCAAEQPVSVSLTPNLNKGKRLAPHFDAMLGKSPAVPNSQDSVQLLTPARRTEHDRQFRLAKFVLAPVIGLITVLYGLLWISGPSADYVGMSRVLPASLLPHSLLVTADSDSSPDAQLADAEPLLEETAAPPTDEPYTQPAAAEALPTEPVVKHDAAVQTAAALQPMTTVSFGRSQGAAKELRGLVEQAAYVLPGFLTSDLSDTASVSRMGKAYMTLSRLAEQMPLALGGDAAPGLQEQAHRAVELFREALNEEGISDDCAHIANAWWGHTGRTNQGIFFRGTLTKMLKTADGAIGWMKVGEKPDTPLIPVLLSHHGYQPGDQVGIVGRIGHSTSQLQNDVALEELVEVFYDFEMGAE